MRSHPLRPNLALVLACLLALLLFFVGIALPEVHFWASYLLPIVLAFLWGRRRDVYIVAAVASVLLVAAYWTGGTATADDFVTGHLLPLAVVWGLAWLLAQRQQMQEQLAAQQQSLEEQVKTRTAALAASEQRYRLLAENAGDLIWTVDMDGNMTYASPGAQRLRGVTGEEEQSASWFDRLPPAAAARAAAALQADLAALRAGEPIDATPRSTPTYRKDGTLMWTETVMSPIYDDKGRSLGLCGTTRDITARKQLEARAERLAALVDAAQDAVMSADLDGTIVTLNRSAEKIYGTTAAAVVGRTMAALTPPEYVEPLEEMVGRVANGEAMVIDDVAWRLPDGSTRILAISLSPIRDSSDIVIAFSSIARDVTDRKQLEEATNRLAAIVASSPDAIASTDLQGRVVNWNPSAERLYECSASQAIGRPINEILPTGPDTDAAAIVAKVYSGATVAVADRSWTKADGTRVDLSVILSPVKDKFGAVTGMASLARDITARKAAEHALRDSEERFSKLFNSSPVAMIFTRLADRVCQEVNAAFEALTGYSREELIGHAASELGLLQSKAQVQLGAELQEHGTIHQREHMLHAKGGATRDVLFSSELVDFSGETWVLSSIVDITERKAAERERLFLSALVASSPDAVVGRTVDGTITSWNRGAERIFGYTAAEAIGQNLTMLAAPGSREQMVEVMAAVAQGNAVEGVETQRITKDGRIFDCQISSFPVREAGGAIVGVASFTHDITERKAAERALRASEERFARLFNSSPVGLTLTRRSDGLYQEVNDAFLSMIGWSRAEVIGRTSLELGIISPEDRRRLGAEVQVQGSLHGTDLVLQTKHGELLNTLFSIDLVDFGGESYVLFSVVDITRRRQLEEALAASERKYRDLYDNSPDMYFVGVPAQGLVLDCNQTLARTLGYTPEELIGGPSSVLFAPGTYGQLQADRDRLMASGKYRNDAVQLCRRDGTLLDVIMAVTLEQDPAGGPARARVTLHDITERMAAERAVARLAAIVQSSNDAIISADPDGTLRTMNRAAEQLFGFPATEAIGHHISLINPDLSESDRAAMFARLRAGESFTLPDFTWTAHDGRRVALLVTALPLMDAKGQRFGMASIIRDITARKRAEEQLRASEEKFTHIFAANPAAVCVTRRADDVYLEVNDAYVELTGYTRDELFGRAYTALGVFSPTYCEDLQAVVLAEGRVHNVETQITGKSGAPIDCLVSVETIDVDGAPCSQTMLINITERKRAEQALRESQARYQLLADHATDVIWSMDPACKVTYVSPSTLRQSGFTPEDTIGLTLEQTFAPGSRAAARATIGEIYRLIQAGQPVPATPNVFEMLRKDGTTYWGENIYSVVYNAQGEFQQLVGATREVTKRVHAEAQLHEAYQRLQLATDAAGIGIWNWNFASSSLEWDDRMCELYAVTAAECTAGVSYALWHSRIHPDDLALAEPEQGDLTRVGGQWSGTYRIVLPDGAVRYIQASSVTQYTPDGVPRLILGINRDVTDQKHYERLLQDTNAVLEEHVAARTAELRTALADLQRANQLKDEFMAMISHELRTPLTGVLSMSEMLEDQVAGPLNDRQSSYVKNIIHSGERLLAVIKLHPRLHSPALRQGQARRRALRAGSPARHLCRLPAAQGRGQEPGHCRARRTSRPDHLRRRHRPR